MIVEKTKQKQSNYSDFCFLLAARTCRFSLSLPGFGVRFVFHRFVLQSQTTDRVEGNWFFRVIRLREERNLTSKVSTTFYATGYSTRKKYITSLVT